MAELGVDRHDGLIEKLVGAGRERGAYLVLRFQERRGKNVSIEETRLDSVGASFAAGLGVQAFTESGHNGFAAVDDPDEERAMSAVSHAVAAAEAARQAGLDANTAILSRAPDRGRAIPEVEFSFDHLTAGEMRDRTHAFARRVAEACGDVGLRSGFSLVRDEWRIARSDGTDVSFVIPRSFLGVSITARGDGEAVSTNAMKSGVSWELLLSDRILDEVLADAARAADLARDLLVAPSYPAGSYRLLIDYALAKGLAHEAFGHAAESDSLDSSILGDGGRFRAGERFGSEAVSIIDEPLEGDNAWQPFSGNGVPRERAVILDRGVLRDSLADIHTAGRAGTRVTGSSRLQSFSSVPVPRMTNIRIELDDVLPMPTEKRVTEWTPEEIRDLLVESGDLPEGGKVVFLSGYRGGQVNPALGDFVFNCTALYELTPDAVELFKPGIFTGTTEAALHAIRRGFGPLTLDAAGTCGKAGQHVPSSGGSYQFVLMDEDPDVRIGGRS